MQTSVAAPSLEPLSQSNRNHVAGGPPYQPDLALTPDYVGDIYGYYGYAPYWGAGYAYPPYPFYPR